MTRSHFFGLAVAAGLTVLYVCYWSHNYSAEFNSPEKFNAVNIAAYHARQTTALTMIVGGLAVYVVVASVIVAHAFVKPENKLEPPPEPPKLDEAPKTVEEGITDTRRA